MEIALTHPQVSIHQQAILSLPNTIHITHDEHNTSSYRRTATVTTHSSTSSPIQKFQWPLQRPQHKHHQPIKQIPKKISDNNSTAAPSDVLRLMDSLKLPVTLDLYVSFIKECTKMGDRLQAIELHNHIRTSGHCRPTLPLINLLLLMYVSCNCLQDARKLFDRISVRDCYSWAVMIAGYFENGDYGETMDLFVEMRNWDRVRGECDDLGQVAVSGVVACVLKACAKTMNLEFGKQVHGWIMKGGYAKSVVLSSSLMSFYGKLGSSESSDLIFDQVSSRNTVIWTVKIASCCNNEQFEDAANVFREMGEEGVKKNSFTCSSALKAGAKINDGGGFGRQVHASVIKLGLDLDTYVQYGLVDMYGKHGLVADARKAFKISVNKRNDACWNALVTGFMEQGLCHEAIKALYEMYTVGLQPKESLLREVRLGCGSLHNFKKDR